MTGQQIGGCEGCRRVGGGTVRKGTDLPFGMLAKAVASCSAGGLISRIKGPHSVGGAGLTTSCRA